MLSLDELVRDFRQQDDLIAYLQAASIIDFMVYRLGPEAVSSRYDPLPAGAWESIRAEGCGIDARPAG